MNHKKYPITNIGTSLILVVFIILAIITFASLSLVTTRHDYESSKKIVDRTTAYYEATNVAESILTEIDNALASAYDISPAVYYANIKNVLAPLSGVEADFTSDIPLIKYNVPIEHSQVLQVALQVTIPQDGADAYYQIYTWQEVSTREWNGNTSLNLLGGQTK